MVEFVHVLIEHEWASSVPYSNAVINAKTRRRRGCEDMLPIGTPFAYTGVAGFNGTNLGHIFVKIVDVHLPGQIAEASHEDKAAVRREEDSVART